MKYPVLFLCLTTGLLYGFDINLTWDTITCPEPASWGVKLGTDGTYLYYLPGNNTSSNFWRYDPADDSWEQLASYIAFPNQKDGIGFSRGLDYHDGYFFTLFRSTNWNDGLWLYRYDVSADEWSNITNSLGGASNATWAESITNIHANWSAHSLPMTHINWESGQVSFEAFNCQNCARDPNWTHDFDTHPAEFNPYVYGVKNDWINGTAAGQGDVLWRCLKAAYTAGSPIAVAQLPWNPGAGVACVTVPASRSFSGENEVIVARAAGENANQDGWGSPTPDISVYALDSSRWLSASELPVGADRSTDITEINGVLYVKTGENSVLYVGKRVHAGKPNTPVNVFPTNGSQNVSLSTKLFSSVYFDSNALAHSASRWQVSENSSFDAIAWDSRGSILQLTNATVMTGILTNNTRYYWRVSYANVSNVWSEWSQPSWFETLSVPPSLSIPVDWTYFIGPENGGSSAKIGSDGTYLYFLPGSATSNFWRYDPEDGDNGTWTALAPTPGLNQNAMGFSNGLDYHDGYLYVVLKATNNWGMFYRYNIDDDEWEELWFVPEGYQPTHACWAGPGGTVTYAPWGGGGGAMVAGNWQSRSLEKITFHVQEGFSPNWLSRCTDTSPAEFNAYVYGIKNDWDWTNVVSSGELLWCVPQDNVSAGNFNAIRAVPWPLGAGCSLVALPAERSLSGYDEVFVIRGAGTGGSNQDGFGGFEADDIGIYLPDFDQWYPVTALPFPTGEGSDITELKGYLYVKEGMSDFFYKGELIPEPATVFTCLVILILLKRSK
jgi:hypothetical protein